MKGCWNICVKLREREREFNQLLRTLGLSVLSAAGVWTRSGGMKRDGNEEITRLAKDGTVCLQSAVHSDRDSAKEADQTLALLECRIGREVRQQCCRGQPIHKVRYLPFQAQRAIHWGCRKGSPPHPPTWLLQATYCLLNLSSLWQETTCLAVRHWYPFIASTIFRVFCMLANKDFHRHFKRLANTSHKRTFTTMMS